MVFVLTIFKKTRGILKTRNWVNESGQLPDYFAGVLTSENGRHFKTFLSSNIKLRFI